MPRQIKGDDTVVVPEVPAKLMSEGLGVNRPAVDEKDRCPASTTLVNGDRVSLYLKV